MCMPACPKGYSLFLNDLARILDCSRQDLLLLKGRSLFLTGCTAFIGRWLMESLLWANQQLDLGLRLAVLTRSPASFLAAMPHLAAHKSLCLVQGSILSLPEQDIPDFDLAIHGVNLPNDAGSGWPARHMLTAVSGTESLMDMAAAIFCCSPPGPFTEHSFLKKRPLQNMPCPWICVSRPCTATPSVLWKLTRGRKGRNWASPYPLPAVSRLSGRICP